MQEHQPNIARLCLTCTVICLVLFFTANVHGAPLATTLLHNLASNSSSSSSGIPAANRPTPPPPNFHPLHDLSRTLQHLSIPGSGDTAPEPVYRISSSSSRPAAIQSSRTLLLDPTPAMPGPQGSWNSQDSWHTSGSRILDSRDQPVRIAGINWYGFETTAAAPHGLTNKDFRAILRTVRDNGYNTIRLPFSNAMIESPTRPDISFEDALGHPINTDLRGLTSLEVMDRIIEAAGDIGLRVILDNHRSEPGNGPEASGLWYTAAFPEASWIRDWQALAARYAATPTVVGMDLRNEPHNATTGGSCWDCNTAANDWRLAAERAGDAILRVNPRLLIFVEGTDTVAGDAYWWGGNLEGIRSAPVRLSVPHRLVYSAHDYGPSEYAQPWFNTRTTPRSLQALWTRRWAFISQAGIAPVWLSEFGTPNEDAAAIRSLVPGSEGQWFGTMIAFLQANKDLSWAYWAVNGDDRYGLLDANFDRTPVSLRKQQALVSIQFPKL